MKVLCDREKLREGLAVANNVIPTKSTKPVLANVCLVATGEALELVGTDLEVALRLRIDEVKVEEPGTAVIPARVAFEFVRDLQGESVSIQSDESSCRIAGGDGQDACELHVADPEEFPVVSRFSEEGSISVQGGSFTALVGRTAFAAAREQGRYAMHGVRVEVEGDELRMIATDGRRLALAKAPVDGEGMAAKTAIVPTKAMQLFCRVVADPLEQVRLAFEPNQIALRTARAEVFARLLDGDFPRYDSVIPREASNLVSADSELLARKIRLVANVTGDEARAVRFSLSKDHLELFGQSAGKGEARAHMDVEFSGAEAEIAFNPDYVVEGLKNCESGQVTLEFNERTSPGKFKLGEDYTYVVMPITIDA
jgi:DNA polymerase III subunit beta